MSTYYYIACDKCQEYADFYTRQAWGYGNADPVLAFKFACLHTRRCGHESLRVISEHSRESDTYEWVFDSRESIDKFIEDTAGMWPYSSDWTLPSNVDEAQAEFAQRMQRRGD